MKSMVEAILGEPVSEAYLISRKNGRIIIYQEGRSAPFTIAVDDVPHIVSAILSMAREPEVSGE